jgi:hypothetical protein
MVEMCSSSSRSRSFGVWHWGLVFWGNMVDSKRWGVQEEECHIQGDGVCCWRLKKVLVEPGVCAGARIHAPPEERCHFLEDLNPQCQYCGNLKSCAILLLPLLWCFVGKYGFCLFCPQVIVFACAICSSSYCSVHFHCCCISIFSSLTSPSQDNRNQTCEIQVVLVVRQGYVPEKLRTHWNRAYRTQNSHLKQCISLGGLGTDTVILYNNTSGHTAL